MIGRISIVAASTLIAGAAGAQTSELYLTNWSTTHTYVVQGGQITRVFNRQNTQDGPGLVVQDTIKMIGQDGGGVGHEYDYSGNLLGGQYLNPQYTSLYDGATDGTRNWSIAHNDFATNFALVEADADWSNMRILFVPARRSSGVTYDANSGTLWITNNSGGVDRVQQFDLSGNLISEFPADHSGGGYGIAWDPADDTLWIPGAFGTSGQLFQYDKDGNLLQIVGIAGLGSEILGAEFASGPSSHLTLEVSGDCPGTITATAGGAEPRVRVHFIYSFREGAGPAVPGCPDLIVDLLNPQIAGSAIANADGEATLSGPAPAAACGRVFIQAVDKADCRISDVVGI